MAMNDPNQKYLKYCEVAGHVVRTILPEIRDKLTIADNEKVLDVGCGPGINTSITLTAFLPNSTIVGSDFSEEMIDYAKKHHTTNNITFKVLDITNGNIWNSWNREEFTKIFSFYTMHRISNLRTAYENIYNLMKPGGELITITPTANVMEKVLPYLAKVPKYLKYADAISKMRALISPAEDYKSMTVELLKSTGFEVKVGESVRKSFVAPSVDYLVEFYGIVSYLSRILPSNLFEEALKDMKKIILENDIIEESSAGYLIVYQILVIVAKKPL